MLSAAGPVYGAPNRHGDRTLRRVAWQAACERMAVSSFCHWRLCVAATGGEKETQRGSSNLPHANIYITHSPASAAQGWGGGGGFPRGSVLMAQDPARSPFSTVELVGLSCSLLVWWMWAIFLVYLTAPLFPPPKNAEMFPGQADGSVLSQSTQDATTRTCWTLVLNVL